MAFEINDLKGFLLMILLSLAGVAPTDIDCHGKPFHCINSTHFLICVDLGGGISTTIDDFMIPCPLTTSCHVTNKYECEFEKPSDPIVPLEVIGVTKVSDISETSSITNSAMTTTPSIDLDILTSEVYLVTSEVPDLLKVNESVIVITTRPEDTNDLNRTVNVVDITVFSSNQSDVTRDINRDEAANVVYTTKSIGINSKDTNDYTVITESNSDHNFIVDSTTNNNLPSNLPSPVTMPPTETISNVSTTESAKNTTVLSSDINQVVKEPTEVDHTTQTVSTQTTTNNNLPSSLPSLETIPTINETLFINTTEKLEHTTELSSINSNVSSNINYDVNKATHVVYTTPSVGVDSKDTHNFVFTTESDSDNNLMIETATNYNLSSTVTISTTEENSNINTTETVKNNTEFSFNNSYVPSKVNHDVKEETQNTTEKTEISTVISSNNNNVTSNINHYFKEKNYVIYIPDVATNSKDTHNFTDITESISDLNFVVETTTYNNLPSLETISTIEENLNFNHITEKAENPTTISLSQSDVTYTALNNDFTTFASSSDTVSKDRQDYNFEIEHTTNNIQPLNIPKFPLQPSITKSNYKNLNDVNKTGTVDNNTVFSSSQSSVIDSIYNPNANKTTSVLPSLNDIDISSKTTTAASHLEKYFDDITTNNPPNLPSSSTTESVSENVNLNNFSVIINTGFKSEKPQSIYPVLNETSPAEYTTPNIDIISKDVANLNNSANFDVNIRQKTNNNTIQMPIDLMSTTKSPTTLENIKLNNTTAFISELNKVTHPYQDIKDTTAFDATQNLDKSANNSQSFTITTVSNTNNNVVDDTTTNIMPPDSLDSTIPTILPEQNVLYTANNKEFKITTPVEPTIQNHFEDIQNIKTTTQSSSDPDLIGDLTTNILPSSKSNVPLIVDGITTAIHHLENLSDSDTNNGTQDNSNQVLQTSTTNNFIEYEFSTSASVQQNIPNSSTLVEASSNHENGSENDNKLSGTMPNNITQKSSSALEWEFANQDKNNTIEHQNNAFNVDNNSAVIDTKSLSIDEHDKLNTGKLQSTLTNEQNIPTKVLSENVSIIVHLSNIRAIPSKDLEGKTGTKLEIIPQNKEITTNNTNSSIDGISKSISTNLYSVPNNDMINGTLFSLNKDVNTVISTFSVRLNGKTPSESETLNPIPIKINNTNPNFTKNYTTKVMFDNSKSQANISWKLEPTDNDNAATLFLLRHNSTNVLVTNKVSSKPILNEEIRKVNKSDSPNGFSKYGTEYFVKTISKNNSSTNENSSLMHNTNNDLLQIISETTTSLPLDARDITSNYDTVSISDKNVKIKSEYPPLATTTKSINNNYESASLTPNKSGMSVTESVGLIKTVTKVSIDNNKVTVQQVPLTTVTPVLKATTASVSNPIKIPLESSTIKTKTTPYSLKENSKVAVKVIPTSSTIESIKSTQTKYTKISTLQETTPLTRTTNSIPKYILQSQTQTPPKLVNTYSPSQTKSIQKEDMETSTSTYLNPEKPDRKLEVTTSTIPNVKKIPERSYVPTQITKPEPLASVTQIYPTKSTIVVQKVVYNNVNPNTNNTTASIQATQPENGKINYTAINVKYPSILRQNSSFVNNTLSSNTFEQKPILKQNPINVTHMVFVNKSGNSLNNISNTKQSFPKVLHNTVKNQTNIITTTILTNENNIRKTPVPNKIEQTFLAETIQVNVTNAVQLDDFVVSKSGINPEDGKSSYITGSPKKDNDRESHEIPEAKEKSEKRRTNFPLLEILSPEKVENVVNKNIYPEIVSKPSALNKTEIIKPYIPRDNISINTPKPILVTSITAKQNNVTVTRVNITSINKNTAGISNTNKSNSIRSESVFLCPNHSRGRYADNNDCRKFYICIGNHQPITGSCPNDTVFSAINKHCTKNLSHCVRNNQFKCLREGRFSDFLNDNVYYICVKDVNNNFLRYKLLCQKGHRLNKATVKCEKIPDISSQSISSISESISTTVRNKHKVKSHSQTTPKPRKFECKNEGKFPHETACNKYYVCTKNKKGEYRQRLVKCESEEVYSKRKEKCIESESNGC